jgi:hypothetical protein
LISFYEKFWHSSRVQVALHRCTHTYTRTHTHRTRLFAESLIIPVESESSFWSPSKKKHIGEMTQRNTLFWRLQITRGSKAKHSQYDAFHTFWTRLPKWSFALHSQKQRFRENSDWTTV